MKHLSLARKRKIHLALIDAFEKIYHSILDSVAATIVNHCIGAGQIKLAYQYTLMAAQYANKAFAPDDANHLFQSMESLLTANIYLFGPPEIISFYTQWARGNLQFNERDLAITHAEKLLQFGHRLKDDYLIGTGYLYLGLAKSSNQLGSSDPMQYFDKAIMLLNNLPPTLELIHCKVEKAVR